MSKKRKVVIFDFDGVVVDSFNQLYEINRLAAKEIGKVLTQQDYRSLFVGNIHQKISDFVGVDIKKQKIFTDYKYKIFSEFYNENTIKLFGFSEEMIKSIAKIAELVIISSAPEDLISKILKNKKIDDYFTNISGINKNGKKEMIVKQLNNNQDTFFITDTVGDLLEVSGLNIVSLGVVWGFHNKKELLDVKPTHVVNDYQELVRLISEQ